MRKKGLRDKGAITVEAAICLPFFIVAVMAFAFLIKVYFAHEIIQQAITGACDEMSVYSLLYYRTNAEELFGGIEKFCNSEKVSNTIGDPKILSYIQEFGKDATDYVRAQAVLVPMSKYLVKKNLSSSSSDDADTRLRYLHLKDGFESIDFTHSRMLADGKSIDIVAKYRLEFPFLSQLLPGIGISQTASACIWAGEDGIDTSGSSGEETIGQSIWDMENIKRGREIRKLQGANLPFNFPVIARYENGTAACIKSLNLDELYYHNTENLQKKLTEYINKLQEFNEGKTSTVTIDKSEIFRKELILVIPETDILPAQQQTLNECIRIAKEKGIDMKIVKAYGKQNPAKDEVDNAKVN